MMASRHTRSLLRQVSTTARPLQHQTPPPAGIPPLSILPLSAVVRTLAITTISSSPVLLNTALRGLDKLLQRERNADPFGGLLRRTLYAQFCAGETPEEVGRTVAQLKQLGFAGVILGYAREAETVADTGTKDTARAAREIREWADGTLKTVDLAGDGDMVALKLTGAGQAVVEHLLRRSTDGQAPPPPELEEALAEICERAGERNVRLLVDAEHDAVQKAIDEWVLRLQRQYNNRDQGPISKPRALVYGTYQAYRKSTPEVLARHLAAAQSEGFVLGVKLVRGAYLGSDARHLFWETKQGTDEAYDAIAAALITGDYSKFRSFLPAQLPEMGNNALRVDLVLATHNRQSVRNARALRNQQAQAGRPLIEMAYAQLQGMADDLSCELVKEAKAARSGGPGQEIPKPYKYLVWGSVNECTRYLVRRAQENRDAACRTEDSRQAMLEELKRRIGAAVKGRSQA